MPVIIENTKLAEAFKQASIKSQREFEERKKNNEIIGTCCKCGINLTLNDRVFQARNNIERYYCFNCKTKSCIEVHFAQGFSFKDVKTFLE